MFDEFKLALWMEYAHPLIGELRIDVSTEIFAKAKDITMRCRGIEDDDPMELRHHMRYMEDEYCSLIGFIVMVTPTQG